MAFFHALIGILNGMSPYILLGFFIAGLLHAFVKPAAMSRHLAGHGIGAVAKAALFGIPLPLCSCGVLPTAVSLRRNGASRAASTSFLIATPQTGVDSIAATYSLLGPFMAVIRPVAALVGSVLGGMAVGKLAEGDLEEADECECGGDGCHCHSAENDGDAPKSFGGKVIEALKYGFVDMVQHVGKWLVIGLIVGAAITVAVPDNLLLGLSKYPLLAMLVMVAIAVPMYVCATGSIPIALSLMLKGLTPGVAFVLLMAGPAANFASVLVLRRAMGAKATAVYVLSVVVTAIAFGLAIDLLVPQAWLSLPAGAENICHHGHGLSVFDTLCSSVLVGLLAFAWLKRKNDKSQQSINQSDMEKTYKITGMMCPHCEANVKRGLAELPGVEQVVVNLSKGTAVVGGNVASADVIAKVRLLGYEAEIAE